MFLTKHGWSYSFSNNYQRSLITENQNEDEIKIKIPRLKAWKDAKLWTKIIGNESLKKIDIQTNNKYITGYRETLMTIKTKTTNQLDSPSELQLNLQDEPENEDRR